MTQMPSGPNAPMSFAAFLHCPQNFPSDKEKAAMTAAMECPNAKDTVTEFLKKYIHPEAQLETTGLRAVYQKIRNEVVDKNLFYNILIGYYEMRDDSPELCKYITPSRMEITLTVESVCVALMNEFFNDHQERERLTVATPLFDTYYTE